MDRCLAVDQRLSEGLGRVSGSPLQQPTGLQPVDLLEACCQTQSWWLRRTKEQNKG